MTTIALTVPFERKDEAKALGARWNRFKKTWYAPAGVDLAPFEALGLLNRRKMTNARRDKKQRLADIRRSATVDRSQASMDDELRHLDVPPGYEGFAKTMGAHYDPTSDLWYLEADTAADAFQKAGMHVYPGYHVRGDILIRDYNPDEIVATSMASLVDKLKARLAHLMTMTQERRTVDGFVAFVNDEEGSKLLNFSAFGQLPTLYKNLGLKC